jgi:hypothetical protein
MPVTVLQIMALKGRIDFQHLDSVNPSANLLQVPITTFLPSVDDNYTMREDMIHAVSLILVNSLPAFSIFKDVIPEHFRHQYSENMKNKTEIVSFKSNILYIFLKTPYNSSSH